MNRYNIYAFYPQITYYRKCEVDIGKIDGHLTTHALTQTIDDIDNWLFNFDSVYSADSIQSQYVITISFLL